MWELAWAPCITTAAAYLCAFDLIDFIGLIVPSVLDTWLTKTNLVLFDRRFRKETTPYNFVFLPDASQLVCPLTGEPYIIEINEEANSVRVSSPIRSYRDNRYGFFALKTRSHGYIIDGTRSWDN